METRESISTHSPQDEKSSGKKWHIILLVVVLLGLLVGIYAFLANLTPQFRIQKDPLTNTPTQSPENSKKINVSFPDAVKELNELYPPLPSGYGVYNVSTVSQGTEVQMTGDLGEVTETTVQLLYSGVSEPLILNYNPSLNVFPQDLVDIFPNEWYQIPRSEFIVNVRDQYINPSRMVSATFLVKADGSKEVTLLQVVPRPDLGESAETDSQLFYNFNDEDSNGANVQ